MPAGLLLLSVTLNFIDERKQIFRYTYICAYTCDLFRAVIRFGLILLDLELFILLISLFRIQILFRCSLFRDYFRGYFQWICGHHCQCRFFCLHFLW